jgi:hypothetical protein
MKNLEKNLTTVISNILDIANDEAKQHPLFSFFMENKQWFSDPDECSTMVVYTFRKILQNVIGSLHNTDNQLILHIYSYYEVYETNCSELCHRLYGMAFSSDRGHYIVQSTMQWQLTGKLPTFEPSSKNYHHPKTGTPQQWMDYVLGIKGLMYGKPEAYLKSYKELVEGGA